MSGTAVKRETASGGTRLVMGICGIGGSPGGAGKGADEAEGVAEVNTGALGTSLGKPPPGTSEALPLGLDSPIERLGMLGTGRLGKGGIVTG
jgi:hypothetical protein